MTDGLRRSFFLSAMLLCGLAPMHAAAQASAGDNPGASIPHESSDGLDSFLSDWRDSIIRARASEPNWSSPLVTSSSLLLNRVRFDTDFIHAGNGANTVQVDGTRGIALIVGDTTEIQIAPPAHVTRRNINGKTTVSDFADAPFFRVTERLASSPEDQGSYVLSALFQVEAPTGNQSLSNKAWIFFPSLGFGKGWGDFDIQGMITASLPAANVEKLGHSLQTNIAFQYRILTYFTPELEANWTYFPDGQHAGLHQLFFTAGVTVGRFAVTEHLRFTVGAGYEFAIAPRFRAQPLAPAFDHSWILSTRFNFE